MLGQSMWLFGLVECYTRQPALFSLLLATVGDMGADETADTGACISYYIFRLFELQQTYLEGL